MSPPLTPYKMFCACCRRRRVAPEAVRPTDPAPVFTPLEPILLTEGCLRLSADRLTIRIPKRTRWAPFDDAHKELFREKVKSSLEHLDKLPLGERRFRGAIILFNDIIAQPLYLASVPSFRAVAANKMEEIEAYAKAHSESRYQDEFREMAYQWHELMTEIHDHPLYKED